MLDNKLTQIQGQVEDLQEMKQLQKNSNNAQNTWIQEGDYKNSQEVFTKSPILNLKTSWQCHRGTTYNLYQNKDTLTQNVTSHLAHHN